VRSRLLAFTLVCAASPAWGVQDVASTVHNLSASGPGVFKSLTIDQVCVFCHTPHGAQPASPLWNHELSGQVYLEYRSSTLDASPEQPTGRSRLCLACHDGTVALGAMVNPPDGVVNDLASTFLTGRANLGTDLTDDHPISFVYDSALQAADPELANPTGIDLPLENDELQCTSCHDPHEADRVPFLRKTTAFGELCITCHVRSGLNWEWSTSSHATSPATASAGDPWSERKPEWKGATVAENACFNCHAPHNATTPPRLIKDEEERTCYLCHDGSVAATDIQSEALKLSNHPVDVTPNADHDATLVEDPQSMPLHVECADCHNGHAVRDAPPMVSVNPLVTDDHATPPLANGRILGVSGLDLNGFNKPQIEYQYELCFKCHGVPLRSACDDRRCPTADGFSMERQDGIYNLREKVSSTATALVSYHPIESNNTSNNTEVPSLRADIGLNRFDSLIYCTDCHNSDESIAAGRLGPNGPHGSQHRAILAREYAFEPQIAYSAFNYELCYKCHNESVLLSDASGFTHSRHVERRGAACIVCHDPHGSHSFEHLLNFLTSAEVGGEDFWIRAVEGFSAPFWQDDGIYQGTCYLDCHGARHNPRSYR